MNLILLVVFSMSFHSQPPTRKLLLFGKDKPYYQKQLALLAQDSAGIAERDLIVVMVEDKQLFESYKLGENEFTLLLIGKDGGEKMRSTKPVKLEAIFALIDSMPMRQREMQRKKNE